MFLLIFVVFLLPPSHTHPPTTSYFNPLTPPPLLSTKFFQSPILYKKKEEICEPFGMNTKKKQGSVFMELSSSIDFYMPCSLVILTYVKAEKLHTPTHRHPNSPPSQRHSKSLRRLLHSAVRSGTSQLWADAGFHVCLIVRRVQPTRCNVSQSSSSSLTSRIGPFDPFRLQCYSCSRQRFFGLPIVLLPCGL